MTSSQDIPFAVGLIFLPLVAGIAIFLLRRGIALLSSLAAVGTGASVFGLGLQVFEEGPQTYSVGGWPAPLGIQLYADRLSVVLLVAAALVVSVSGLYSHYYLPFERSKGCAMRGSRAVYWSLGFILWAALNALSLSGDAFNLYVTFELLGLAAVALTATEGGQSLSAALRYLLASLLGSMSYLLGVALLYTEHATLDLGALGQVLEPSLGAGAAAALMTAGLTLKTALFPLHFWLPAAHANAPTPVSAVLSGIVVKASFYVLLRLWLGIFSALDLHSSAQLLGALGAAGVFWGSLAALRQVRLKLLIAYSTVAQVGYLFVALPLVDSAARNTALAGVSTFILAHASAKAAMFLVAGNVLFAAGQDRLPSIRNAFTKMPLSLTAFALAGASLMGIPPSGGFVAKWMLFGAALHSGQWSWVAVLGLGTLLTGAYLFRVLQCVFEQPAQQALKSVPPAMEWMAFALALFSLAVGGTLRPVAQALVGLS